MPLRAYLLNKSLAYAEALQDDFEQGQPFLPLDATGTNRRLRLILDETRPDELVTTEEFAKTLKDLPCNFSASYKTQFGVLYRLEWSLGPRSWSADLAYILYTSGSSGRPKGVMISRSNAHAFIGWARSTFPMASTDVLASIAPFHFDLSVFDLHASRPAKLWIPGKEAVTNPRMMVAMLAEAGVTAMYCTPTFLNALVQYGKCERHDLSAMRLILFAGEPFRTQDILRALEAFPTAEFHNLYGPTETNVVTHWPINRNTVELGICPIGRPVSGATLRLDDTGELCVSGPSVFSGYVDETNSPALNEEGEYRTGDRVVRLENGEYLFTGRIDDMIKRRGYRIEPAEIEAAFLQFAGMIDNLCLPVKGGRLVLFYRHVEGEQGFEALAEFGSNQIPQWMLPDSYAYLAKWPLTASGKIDRKALQNIYS
jgi:acyl-coenzyme A synthetase/AMP-(fatty) acid ligase